MHEYNSHLPSIILTAQLSSALHVASSIILLLEVKTGLPADPDTLEGAVTAGRVEW